MVEITDFFKNETENGKLYLSFPMIEAYYKPVKHNFKFDKTDFIEEIAKFSDFKKQFKEISVKDANSQYKKIINFYFDNIKEMLGIEYQEMNMIKILKNENELLKTKKRIVIYSAIPIFLIIMEKRDYEKNIFGITMGNRRKNRNRLVHL